MLFQACGLGSLAGAFFLFGVGFVCLSGVTSRFSRLRVCALLVASASLVSACWLCLVSVAGVVSLALFSGVRGGSFVRGVVVGAVLGLVAYGTYDMTNLATLKNWSLSLSVVDMAWGTFLTSLAATSGYFITTWIAARSGG
nr:DUF2177 family protein [Kaistia granuli]